MSKLLEGKVVVVTGAGAGSARASHSRLRARAHGWWSTVWASPSTAAAAVQVPRNRQWTRFGPLAALPRPTPISVTEWASAHRIVAQAVDLYGRIDAVVNNAGNLRDGIFHKMPEADFDAVIQVHVKGSFNMSRAAAPHFQSEESGAYVHMSSTSGLIGKFGQANYCAAKMGVVGLSKGDRAWTLERFNVRSNCIAPFAFTRMVNTIPTDTPEGTARMLVNARLEADKIAPFTCALLTDQAKHVTGQIFGVRNNEIYLFSQPRPIRSAHAGDQGWTVESCLERALPMMRPSFFGLDRSKDVFSWDPV